MVRQQTEEEQKETWEQNEEEKSILRETGGGRPGRQTGRRTEMQSGSSLLEEDTEEVQKLHVAGHPVNIFIGPDQCGPA